MKFQKAKSIVHQFGVSQKDLEEAKVFLEFAEKTHSSLVEEPNRLRAAKGGLEWTLTDIERQMSVLNESRARLKEEIHETTIKLNRPVEGLEAAENTLAYARGKVRMAEMTLQRLGKDLPEAEETIRAIKTREEEEAKNPVKMVPHPLQKKIEKGTVTRKIPLHRGKDGVIRGNYDPMGNKPLPSESLKSAVQELKDEEDISRAIAGDGGPSLKAN